MCALYLKFLGCISVNCTPPSHDQGIDFVGVIHPEDDARFFAKNRIASKIYIIGQAKHYQSEKVHSHEVRELAGSLHLLKSRNFALAGDIYKNLEINAYTPIYAYFITSNYFTSAARQLCLNADIMDVDRILLALTFATNSQYHDGSGTIYEQSLWDALHTVSSIS
ncbi:MULTISPECIES: restriction endonuclease [Aneurinibacillus]|uniref:restriction endonuclease n=1 Tax=Aneurinibacillus TaxID=55079 RepID=UPI0011BF7CFE|nr:MULTISPECIES: restriction endonuclease [Aneurinibacillus]